MHFWKKIPFSIAAVTAFGCAEVPQPKEPEVVTESIRMKLQSTTGGFLFGLEGTVNVYQDASDDAGTPCSTLGPLVATEDTVADDTDLPFALVAGDYCFELADGWTLYYDNGTDASVNWVAIPSGDVEHTTDPHPVPVSVSQNSVDDVTFVFDWVPPAIDEDYGAVTTEFVVFTNECSGVCGNDAGAGGDAGAGSLCAIINDAPAACYPSCERNADCADVCPEPSPNGLCLRGNVPMANPGICVCQ